MAVKKGSKKTMESINARLQLVVKSGKYVLGYRQTMKALRLGKAKLVILANNTPQLRKSETEYYAMLAKTGVHHYSGNNVDLGTACGKYFHVGALAITDPGDSDIIRSMPGGVFGYLCVFSGWMLTALLSASKSWSVVERLCFPAPSPSYDLTTYPQELILVPRDDGMSVPCLFLPFVHARFLIVYFHGNGEDLGSCYTFCNILRDLFQVHMLAVEYPGYGLCEGTTTEAGIMANASAVMRFVTSTLSWPLDSVKLLGRSLGTAPSIALATIYKVSGLILVSPFLGVRDVARSQIGSVADHLEDWFPNYKLCAHIRSPTLIIHGQKDQLIPVDHGKRIFERIRSRKMLVCPPAMSHNSCLLKNVKDFVLPMTEFFSLPDYSFDPIEVPDWVFPAMCPSSSRQESSLFDEVPTDQFPPCQRPSCSLASESESASDGEAAENSCMLPEDSDTAIPNISNPGIHAVGRTHVPRHGASRSYFKVPSDQQEMSGVDLLAFACCPIRKGDVVLEDKIADAPIPPMPVLSPPFPSGISPQRVGTNLFRI